jgi:transposase-like protein
MPRKYTPERKALIAQTLFQHDGNQAAAARALGMKPNALNEWLRNNNSDPAIKTAMQRGQDTLSYLGYNLSAVERTPEQAWADHAGATERKLSSVISKQWRQIKRPRGPSVVFHATDGHIDDDAAPLRLIEEDIKAAHDMNAIMCHGGDLLNNWPLAGKLAKQWAEQSCTLPDALLRAQHFINIFKPDVWTHGNHEEMNPYLMSMLDGWLPKGCLTDYWSVNFEIVTPGGRPFRAIMSHKFQKGSSWFHPHHGVIRESMEAEPADLYMEGHIHVSGVIYRSLPERGVSFTGVSSAGYKVVDKYAARISRGGKIPKLKGRAHWIVCDDQPDDGHAAVAFDCALQAEAYLGGLQNLRAV